MQTHPMNKSELIASLENVLELIKNDDCPMATVSWDCDTFGSYNVIGFIQYKKPDGSDAAMQIGKID